MSESSGERKWKMIFNHINIVDWWWTSSTSLSVQKIKNAAFFTQNKFDSRAAAPQSKRGCCDSCAHPFSSTRLRFSGSFGHATVSLSPSNLIVKPQACRTVLAAHIWTNSLGEKDTNLSGRWQRNDERGRKASERGNSAVASTCLYIHLRSVWTESSVRLQVIPLSGFRQQQQHSQPGFIPGLSFKCLSAWKLETMLISSEKCGKNKPTVMTGKLAYMLYIMVLLLWLYILNFC